MDLPSSEELLRRDPPGSSWGLWGPDDVRGCLNLLDPRRGIESARKGAAFALNWNLTLPDPPLFERPPLAHDVTWLTRDAGHDETLHLNTQSSSQWDGFRHIRHPTYGFYNAVPDEDHGVDRWGGFVGRGVLCDVARWRADNGRPISPGSADPIEPEDTLRTLEAQQVEVEVGDVLLLRTGWLDWYSRLPEQGRRLYAEEGHPATGLRPGEESWRMLWDLHIAAVAADNPSLEVWPLGSVATQEDLDAFPTEPDRIFMHYRLLPLLGLPIGEMWDLEALADDCADDGVYDFLLTSAPLNVPSGVASPPNALAIK